MTKGRVQVNGQVVTELGARANPLTDAIEVDGAKITGAFRGPRVYVLLNKPKGYISSVTDPLHRPVVTDIVKVGKARVYPVGRLDYDAEGVLLLTNDGELANQLIHPGFHVAKKYLVKVKDVPSAADLERLEHGVHLEDGKTFPAKARMVRQTTENCWIELTVTEGRNRLVKRMCMAIGHPVAKLKRIEFAGIKLGSLEPGAYRLLTDEEVERLKGLGASKKGVALARPAVLNRMIRPKRAVAPRKLARRRNISGSENPVVRKVAIALDKPVASKGTFVGKATFDSGKSSGQKRVFDNRKRTIGKERSAGAKRTLSPAETRGSDKSAGQKRLFDNRKRTTGKGRPVDVKRAFGPGETTGPDKPSGQKRLFDNRKRTTSADKSARPVKPFDKTKTTGPRKASRLVKAVRGTGRKS